MCKFRCNHIIISSHISHSSHISYPIFSFLWHLTLFLIHPHEYSRASSIIIIIFHQHPSSILFIIHRHPSSYISLVSSSIFAFIIYHHALTSDYNQYYLSSILHHLSSTTPSNIYHQHQYYTSPIIHHHLLTTTSTSNICSINIHHPASINNTNITQYHLLHHQFSRLTSINIHHQHLCICRFASFYHWK